MSLEVIRPVVNWELASTVACSGLAPGAARGEGPIRGGGRWQSGRHVGEHGALSYRLYLPSGYDPRRPAPLLVMLHGCTQDADDLAAGTRMNLLAEEHGVVVAYPEQEAAAHPQRCWRWYEPAHQRREAGEPALLAALARELLQGYALDPDRVYVAGMSAGAAMSVIVAATYPELFAAVGAHSGLPYGAADGAEAALRAMREGPAPDRAGAEALRAAGRNSRIPPLIVFHGAGDPVVSAAHADALLADWGDVLDPRAGEASEWRGRAGNGYAFRRAIRHQGGRPAVERWVVEGLGHAWSGGAAEGSYTDPYGPDASREMLRFFLSHSRQESPR